MLHSFTGDVSALHPSEQFLMELTSVKDFRVLLQGYLLQAEFLEKFVKLRANIRNLIDACKAVLEDSSLRDMLHLILGVGNYLNQVRHLEFFWILENFKKEKKMCLK